MVQCCNSRCEYSWFHYGCATPPLEEAPADDWFCSDECRDSPHYVCCTCQEKRGGDMVQCFLKGDCKRYEWYHIACLPANDSFPGLYLKILHNVSHIHLGP